VNAGHGSPNGPPPDLANLVDEACHRAGYPSGATLIRHFANAVYLLDNAPVVVRVGYSLAAAAKARTALTVVRWLIAKDFPATAPADPPTGAEQPLVFDSMGQPVTVTFWHYYPQPLGVGWPGTDVLGTVASALHELPTPPFELAQFEPLRTMTAVVRDPAARLALNKAERVWLAGRLVELRATFRELDSPLGRGLIHADMYTGNLLWSSTADHGPVLLGDWDSVCFGPREIDLIPTYAEPRFGTDPATVDAFVRSYGYDLRQWSGFQVLYDIRELSTLSALIRLAPTNAASRAELRHRLGLLMHGDRVTPWHGQ